MRNWFFCVFTLCMIVLATNVKAEKITLKVDQLAALRRKKLNKRMVLPTLSMSSTKAMDITGPIEVTGRTSSGAFTLNTADSPLLGDAAKHLSFNSKGGGQADLTFDNFNIVLD